MLCSRHQCTVGDGSCVYCMDLSDHEELSDLEVGIQLFPKFLVIRTLHWSVFERGSASSIFSSILAYSLDLSRKMVHRRHLQTVKA